jgi:hypothetical protein
MLHPWLARRQDGAHNPEVMGMIHQGTRSDPLMRSYLVAVGGGLSEGCWMEQEYGC